MFNNRGFSFMLPADNRNKFWQRLHLPNVYRKRAIYGLIKKRFSFKLLLTPLPPKNRRSKWRAIEAASLVAVSVSIVLSGYFGIQHADSIAGEMLVREADSIATQVEEKIKREFGDIIEFKIRIESDDAYNKRSQDFIVKHRGN